MIITEVPVENYIIKDLMVPLSEYATVAKGANLLEAVLALEKAQEDFDHTKYKHRGVLILGKNNRVIGKLGHLDVLYALEPASGETSEIQELGDYGFSSRFILSRQRQQRMQGLPFKNLCGKAARLKVEDFMQAPTEDECIDEDAALETAVNQLVMEKRLSLLVTKGKDIVGVLRLADVFAAVFHAMKECEIAT